MSILEMLAHLKMSLNSEQKNSQNKVKILVIQQNGPKKITKISENLMIKKCHQIGEKSITNFGEIFNDSQ